MRVLLSLLFLAAACSPALGALFAVDLGSEFLKMSIVKPGRIPISIVNNEMSKRKTPALVAFVDGERLVGEEAASLVARYPDKIYGRLRDMLGRPADHPGLLQALDRSHLHYKLVPAPNRTEGLAVETDTGKAYSAEELVASLLEYAKRQAAAAADGVPVVDCVLVVPSFFAPAERRALLDAARLAGLNVLSLVHSYAAAALQYGIERDFTNRTENVIFYDMGAGSTEAALVKFSTFTNKKAGTTTSQFEVRDVAWVENLGSDALEAALTAHLADEFDAKHGGGKTGAAGIRASPRAMAKLRKAVKRAKEVLSANSEAPVIVEELHNDVDFRASVTRETFEELAGSFFTRAAAPLVKLLERNNVTVADIAAVELLGGGSRVPRLKAALSEALGGRALDMHLDADEAVVLGAGLFAANLSTTFRLRKFGMADKVPYSVSFEMTAPNPGPEKLLVPAMKKMPTKRVFSFANVTDDGFAFKLHYDNKPGAILPCCQVHSELGAFEVSGIHSVIEKYGESGKVAVHARVDQSGSFHLDRAEAAVEIVEAIPEPPPANLTANGTANDTATANVTVSGNATVVINGTETAGGEASKEGEEPAKAAGEEAAPADEKEEEAAAAPEKEGEEAEAAAAAEEEPAGKADATKKAEPEAAPDAAKGAPAKNKTALDAAEEAIAAASKFRRRTIKVALNVTGSLAFTGLNRTQFEASRKALRELARADEVKRDTARSKNDLEAYIIDMRDKVGAAEEEGSEEEGAAAMRAASTPEERGSFTEALTAAEDWLYGDGDLAAAAEYRTQLRALRDVGDAITRRVEELGARPAAAKAARAYLESTRKAVGKWASAKPWINATEVEALLAKFDEYEKWLEGKEASQGKLADHEVAAFTSDEVTYGLDPLKKAFTRLNNRRKPRPPPVPKAKPANATVGNDTETASAKNGTAAGDEGAKAGADAKAEAGGAKEGGAGDAKEGGAGDAKEGGDAKAGSGEDGGEAGSKADSAADEEPAADADAGAAAAEEERAGAAGEDDELDGHDEL